MVSEAKTAGDQITGGPGPDCNQSAPVISNQKNVLKEAQKKAIDINNQCGMGGLRYFVVRLEEPKGNLFAMRIAIEEMKDSIQEFSVLFVSQCDEQICLILLLPESLMEDSGCDMTSYLKASLASCGVSDDFRLEEGFCCDQIHVHKVGGTYVEITYDVKGYAPKYCDSIIAFAWQYLTKSCGVELSDSGSEADLLLDSDTDE